MKDFYKTLLQHMEDFNARFFWVEFCFLDSWDGQEFLSVKIPLGWEDCNEEISDYLMALVPGYDPSFCIWAE